MGFADKTLKCVDCGAEFTFTAEEQEFYASRGYTNEPKRCPACREAKRSRYNDSRGPRASRQMYTAICAACGKECQVPFEPREGRPVYCSECYSKMKLGSRS
jgi:CxxC-x17-CxxC domain-containing protein